MTTTPTNADDLTSDDTSHDDAGDDNPVVHIDPYLPQPGQHVGRRLLRIDDIPDSVFKDEASVFGTAWSQHLGMEKRGESWEITDPQQLISSWSSRYAGAAGVDGATRAALSTGLNASAQQQISMTGSLLNWAVARPEPPTTTPPQTYALPSEEGNGGSGNSETLEDAIAAEEEERVKAVIEEHKVEEGTEKFYDSIVRSDTGVLDFPTNTWGGGETDTEIDVEAPPEPGFFIVQVVAVNSHLGLHGRGRLMKTTSLLPGESYRFSQRMWRASEEKAALASSIIDSYDEHASARFSETVQSETTDKATRDKSENWYAEAEAGASFGIGSASVSGGGGGEYSSGTEEFSRSMDEAVQEHTSEASAHRETTVTSSTETTTSTEDEQVVEREVRNINVGRTLNFFFYATTQEWIVSTALKDVRIAFSNGNAESWREVPLAELRSLVSEFVRPRHVNRVCREIISTVAVTRDHTGLPVTVIDEVVTDECGIRYQVDSDPRPDDDCLFAAPDRQRYYRFKRGPLAQDGEDTQVDGLVLNRRSLMLGSDSLIVEPLLGSNGALDPYSEDLQEETVRAQRLANDRTALALELVAGGTPEQVATYRDVFGVCCSAEVEESDS